LAGVKLTLSRKGRLTMQPHRLPILALVLVPLAAFGACSDDDGEDTSDPGEVTAVATAAASTPTPSTSGFELPDSPVSLTLSTPYSFNATGRLTPVPADFPFPADSVTVRWYQQDGLYVAHFDGFPTEEALCPGTSIQAGQEFQNAANSPTAPGACANASTLRPPPTGVYRCEGGIIMFLTEIPVATEGTLFASTNRYSADGRAVGLQGSVATDIANTPEIDLSPCIAPAG
jgi:hypothetical protein